jgi:hypothetical protein
MRHNQNRRSRGRSRKGPNPLTRSYESNGPDVKVRGTAAHVAEKYGALARDAQAAGDYIAAESYFQHAEHYNRIVAAAQAAMQVQQRDNSADDNDDDDRVEARTGDGREGGEERAADGQDRGAENNSDGETRKRRRPRRNDQKSGDAEGAPQVAAGSDDSEGETERPRARSRKVNGHDAAAADDADDSAGNGANEPARAKAGGQEESSEDENVTKDGSAALAAFPD